MDRLSPLEIFTLTMGTSCILEKRSLNYAALEFTPKVS